MNKKIINKQKERRNSLTSGGSSLTGSYSKVEFYLIVLSFECPLSAFRTSVREALR
jgi:hypothetical protein